MIRKGGFENVTLEQHPVNSIMIFCKWIAEQGTWKITSWYRFSKSINVRNHDPLRCEETRHMNGEPSNQNGKSFLYDGKHNVYKTWRTFYKRLRTFYKIWCTVYKRRRTVVKRKQNMFIAECKSFLLFFLNKWNVRKFFNE